MADEQRYEQIAVPTAFGEYHSATFRLPVQRGFCSERCSLQTPRSILEYSCPRTQGNGALSYKSLQDTEGGL